MAQRFVITTHGGHLTAGDIERVLRTTVLRERLVRVAAPAEEPAPVPSDPTPAAIREHAAALRDLAAANRERERGVQRRYDARRQW